MIEKDLKEEVRASIIPILLGDGAKAYRLCGALYKTLGMVSLRIGKRRGFADLLGLTCVFRKACAHDRLFCEQLLAIAEERARKSREANEQREQAEQERARREAEEKANENPFPYAQPTDENKNDKDNKNDNDRGGFFSL